VRYRTGSMRATLKVFFIFFLFFLFDFFSPPVEAITDHVR
jgi:hypothetical protein